MRHPITTFAVYLYSILLEAILLIVTPVVQLFFSKKHWNIGERSKIPVAAAMYRGKPVVWVHAASLGEAKLLEIFLNILEQKHPEQHYVCTAATKNGVGYLAGIKRDSVIAVGFLPFDTLRLMKKMLRSFSITRLWVMETELWPSMLYACKVSGVPAGIVNARMEKKSFSSYLKLRFLLAPLFAQFDTVLAQSKPYADRFIQMGVQPNAVHITGNLKSLVPFAAVIGAERNALRAKLGIAPNERVLTAGCLHVGEGTILREALALVAAQGTSIRCVVVPRYPEKAGILHKELGESSLLLHDTTTSQPWNICIVAKVGILDDMYKLCDIAFIGGTFVPIGGHNVWDAARYALPVVFGPDYHTQHEGCTTLLDAQAGFCVNNGHELAEQIVRLSGEETTGIPNAFIALNNAMDNRIQQIAQVLP